MASMIENRTFEEIQIGDEESVTHALRREEIETLAAVTGDLSLIDLDPGPEDTSMFAQGGGQAMWAASLFSMLTGTRLPGLGSITKHLDVNFVEPLPIETPLRISVRVREKRDADQTVLLDCVVVDSEGHEKIRGIAEVIAPTEKMRHERRDMPKVLLSREDRFSELLNQCESFPPMAMAVCHPCSDDALAGALDAAEHGLIEPILVGPEAKIRAVANGRDLGRYRIVSTEHSHGSAEAAVALVRNGEADALMKGSLHTDELLGAVVDKVNGLRTERRISHCFLISVPTYSRFVIVTDAAINIVPTLEVKRDIIQNAIELAHAIGIEKPKVAILSAVETITGKIPSTLEAGALCKMADRGQITGAILDGPLAFDNAIDEQAARTKGIVSPVAGKADILLVPDLEAGNIMAKQLTFMSNAEAAGIVLGARVPIVLTSRADSARTRLASCAVAVLYAAAQRRGKTLLKAAAE
jgi:phosphate acetyltransferase